MATRAVGPGRGWRWLTQAVNLGSQNPKALIGAAAIMVAIAIVPTLIQLLLQQVMGADNMSAMGISVAISLLYTILVMPPAMAGFLRVIHATETGVPTRPSAILDGYRQNPGRIILAVVALTVIAIVVLIALVMLFGASMATGLAEFMAAAQTMQPGDTSGMPALPDGFGTLLAVLLLFGIFFNGVSSPDSH